jgi:hypothetical protein
MSKSSDSTPKEIASFISLYTPVRRDEAKAMQYTTAREEALAKRRAQNREAQRRFRRKHPNLPR